MADAIGRADYQLGADQSPLVNDLKDAEGKIAKSGSNIEKSGLGIGTAIKAGAAVAAGGFALMSKGAIEMEGAQGKFQAATGASREEAVAFSKDMNDLMGSAGAVGKSFEDVAAVGTMVEQQFGTTGDKTKDLTENILEFSKVTGQDATDAAANLEDTLSSYGKTADDAAGFMDTLVASNQKFGTDAGPQTISTLRSMSPALQAMGADLDDGVALLNAFEVAGIDASAAQRGLNSAITKLPPGTTLEEFLGHLQDVKNQGLDPTAEAVKVFGNKAGAALALTLKPGGHALDDFRVSAEEADGAVTTAADNMLTTTDKIRQFADKAGAALRGLGQDIGPLASGLGGLASLAVALPRNLTGPLTDGIKGVFSKLATSAPVKVAAGAAGAAAGVAYNAGIKVVDAMGTALSGAWAAMGKPGSSVITAATAAGGLSGGAFVLGLGIGLPLALAVAAPSIRSGIEDGLGLNKKDGWLAGTVIDSVLDFLSPDMASGAFATAMNPVGAAAADAVVAGTIEQFGSRGPDIAQAQVASMTSGSDQLLSYMETLGTRAGDAVGTGIVASSDHVADDLRESAVFAAKGAEAAAVAAAHALGVETTDALGRGMTAAEATHGLMNQINDLKSAIEKYLTPREQAIQLIGSDYIKTLRKGMNSQDPDLKLTSQDLAIGAIATIEKAGLTGKKGQKGLKDIGVLYDQLLASGMEAEAIAAKLRASGVSETVISGLSGQTQQNNATTSGENIAKAWIAGVASFLHSEVAERRIHDAAADATGGLKSNSPPKKGPLKEIDKWGANVADAWLDPLVGRLSGGARAVAGALSGYKSAFGLSGTADLGMGAPGTMAPMGNTVTVGDINIPITVNGDADPASIGDTVAAKVRGVLDDVFATAERGARLRWAD